MLASNSYTKQKIQTQVDAVIYFFKKMDDEMINDLLFDTVTYQEFSKMVFIQKLKELFYTYQDYGDTLLFGLNEIRGVYNGSEVIALTFVGNKSRMFIEILFEIDSDGYIKDMYEFEDPDFEDNVAIDGGRLFLDNFDDFEIDCTDFDM